jgi:hypothetical protein
VLVEVVFAAVGTLLLAATVIDALWTTLWVDGAGGPVTSRVTSWSWRAVRRVAPRRHRFLSLSGPLILVGTVLGWVVMLWAGWVFLFAAEPQSLIDTRDGGYAGWTGRIWFVAYAMFTMGNGDFSPADGLWQVLSSLVNGSGMFLVTLAITYLLSVISAVVAKRAFASSVHSLGRTGADVVLAGWNGRDLHALDRQLADLTGQLSKLTEQYLSYPVLQYYHAARAVKSPALAVGVFDDALTLLRYGVEPEVRPDVAAVSSARATVDSFLETLEAAFIPAAPVQPPAPDLDRLRKAGVPTVDPHDFDSAVAGLDGRRRSLLGLVRNDGWSWWKE